MPDRLRVKRKDTYRHRYLRARGRLRRAIADAREGRLLTAKAMWGE